jgi:hypothetical protein
MTTVKKLAVELVIPKRVQVLREAQPSLTELEAVSKLFRQNRELYETYREASSIRSASA